MVTQAAVDLFLRAINQKHTQLLAELNLLQKHLAKVAATKEERIDLLFNTITKALGILDDISTSLSDQDKPKWVHRLQNIFRLFLSNKNSDDAAEKLLQHMILHLPEATRHKWVFSDKTLDTDVDFDGIYVEFRQESKLPSLFDSLVSSLEQIINEGGVDSKAAEKALTRLAAALRKNRDGSYFSIICAWRFAAAFVKNYIWLQLKDLPVVKPIVDAFEKTLEDVDAEMVSLQTKMNTELQKRLKMEQPILTYDRSGKSLPPATTEISVKG